MTEFKYAEGGQGNLGDKAKENVWKQPGRRVLKRAEPRRRTEREVVAPNPVLRNVAIVCLEVW